SPAAARHRSGSFETGSGSRAQPAGTTRPGSSSTTSRPRRWPRSGSWLASHPRGERRPRSGNRMRGLRALLLTLLVAFTASVAHADYLEVRRSATIKAQPDGDAAILLRPDVGSFLALLEGAQTNGYYRVRVPGQTGSGWIYRALVRRHPGELPQPIDGGVVDTSSPASVAICSFNIKWLGHYTRKDA